MSDDFFRSGSSLSFFSNCVNQKYSLTMKVSPSVLVTLEVLACSGVWVSVKIRTMMWKSLLSLSCTLLSFFSSEKKTSGVPHLIPAPHSGEGDNETTGNE